MVKHNLILLKIYLDYPKILRIQKTDVDMFKSNLIIFMTLHDLRSIIYRDDNLIKDNFPLNLGGLDIEIGKSYNLQGKSLILITLY